MRVALDRLRRYGLGERVIKSALAAGLAWWCSLLVHADPVPVLAPLTAIFTIQLTLARSLLGSAQRLLGASAGVAIALAATRVFGLEWWAISLVVLVAFLTGLRFFRLEPAGVEQMTVTALLVMILGAGGNVLEVAGFHLIDTAIGTGIGLAANSLIAPPSHVGSARLAVRSVGRRLVAVIESLAGALEGGLDSVKADHILDRARILAAELDDVQEALERAEESLRFNLPGRRQRAVLLRYRRAAKAIEHASVQTRVISRTIADCSRADPIESNSGWIAPAGLGIPLARLFTATALYLDHFLALIDESRAATDDAPFTLAVTDALAEANSAAVARIELMRGGHWMLVGEVLSVTNQLVTDLTSAAYDLRGRSPGLHSLPTILLRAPDQG